MGIFEAVDSSKPQVFTALKVIKIVWIGIFVH
jgi:hypothetical protein